MDINAIARSAVAKFWKVLPSPRDAGSVLGIITAIGIIVLGITAFISAIIALAAAYGVAVLLFNIWVIGLLWKWFILPFAGYQISPMVLAGIWIILVSLRSMLRIGTQQVNPEKATKGDEAKDDEFKKQKVSGKVVGGLLKPFLNGLAALALGYIYSIVLPWFL